MTDNVTNELMYETLKSIQSGVERLSEDMRDLRFRVGSIEREMATISERIAHNSIRTDRMEERLSRIEKRLDLVDA